MAAAIERSGLSGSISIQRFNIVRGAEARECLKRGDAKLFYPKSGLDRRPIIAVPDSRRIIVPNLVIDLAQIEWIKRWRFLSGSARTIKTVAVGSGYVDPLPSDTDLEIPLDSDDIDSWDDALITPDSTGKSITIGQKLWLSSQANGTLSEIGLQFDDATLVTHALFKKLSITGATNANPVRITTSIAHGLATGDEVHINSVGGMTEINDMDFTITVFDADELDLDGEDGTSHGTYTSGGFAFLQVIKSAAKVVQTDYRLEFTS
ncbi:MAG: ubiquitin-activating E1 FCCH domain-containing protein [Gammaproteobacteria bacterium]